MCGRKSQDRAMDTGRPIPAWDNNVVINPRTAELFLVFLKIARGFEPFLF